MKEKNNPLKTGPLQLLIASITSINLYPRTDELFDLSNSSKDVNNRIYEDWVITGNHLRSAIKHHES